MQKYGEFNPRPKRKNCSYFNTLWSKKSGSFWVFSERRSKKNSDIDILVEIEKDISLLDFVGLKLEIEEVLGKKIDLVEYDTLKPFIREKALAEQLPIL